MAEAKVGVAVIGLGGAVATTAVAGIEMLKSGSNSLDGLPLADRSVTGMVDYRSLSFGVCDMSADDLSVAALCHGVIGEKEICKCA